MPRYLQMMLERLTGERIRLEDGLGNSFCRLLVELANVSVVDVSDEVRLMMFLLFIFLLDNFKFKPNRP